MVLVWGGLRGGLSIALALSVPDRLGRNWILAATYIVVVFSILIEGGTMDLFLRRFRLGRVAHLTLCLQQWTPLYGWSNKGCDAQAGTIVIE